MATIPSKLTEALKPVTLICGHYGVGKTNFTCNLAVGLAAGGLEPTVVDLDLVNPYFRASEQRVFLENEGVSLVAPVFAEAGSNLDVPSLRGAVGPALSGATAKRPALVDIGGDDAGTTALGRFRAVLEERPYAMIGVLNCFRNLVQRPAEAVENLREIERASGLRLTGLVSNAHLQEETTVEAIEEGYEYGMEVSRLLDTPLIAVTFPDTLRVPENVPRQLLYPLQIIVKPTWR